MREIRTPGSVRGAARKGRPYRDWGAREGNDPGLPDNPAVEAMHVRIWWPAGLSPFSTRSAFSFRIRVQRDVFAAHRTKVRLRAENAALEYPPSRVREGSQRAFAIREAEADPLAEAAEPAGS